MPLKPLADHISWRTNLAKYLLFFCTFAEYVVCELELVKVVEKAGRGPLATRVKGAATPLEW